MKLITCESVAAITLHLRDASIVPPNYGGHHPRPKALCESEVAWDTRISPESARCSACLKIAKSLTPP